MLVYGINPVVEALRAGKVRRLRISARSDKRMDEILALAAKRGIAVERADAPALDRAAKGGVHQGVVAEIEEAVEYSVADLVLPPKGGRFLQPPALLPHRIQAPHPLGPTRRQLAPAVHAAGLRGGHRTRRRFQ